MPAGGAIFARLRTTGPTPSKMAPKHLIRTFWKQQLLTVIARPDVMIDSPGVVAKTNERGCSVAGNCCVMLTNLQNGELL